MPWIAKKVFVDSSDDFESVLLADVDPLFSTIKEMDGVESFHYFRYNNQEGAFMRVRALAEENAVSAAEQEFQDHLNHAAIESIEPEEFDGNEEQWGEAAWDILYKHFEYMSETALRILNTREAGELGTPEEVDYDTPVLSGEKAETDPLLERHMHLLANQLGYGLQEEAQFHQIQAMAKGLSPDQCKAMINQLTGSD